MSSDRIPPAGDLPAPERRQLITQRGAVSLADWQERAVDRWWAGDEQGPHRGTLEIFTGGGKTIIALSALARASEATPDLRFAVVVPTEALARQWLAAIMSHTSIGRAELGLLGAGRNDTFAGRRGLVAVLNSAARKLPELARGAQPLMLIVDECHRAGAPGFSRVLDTVAPFRLGLSATPERDETDEHGMPLRFDEQAVGRKLGRVVFRFGLKEARAIGWLPEYSVFHHGVQLTESEAREYEQLSRKVNDQSDRLAAAGLQTSQAWFVAARKGESAALAQRYIGALSARKDFLYRVSERGRVAARLVGSLMNWDQPPKVLLFHERVAEAEALFQELQAKLPEVRIALEHSQLPSAQRRAALDQFRSGEVRVLVSVKSLVEGIDVPDADVGISVASSSSVRQRIQTLGRVLRRRFDGGAKEAEMHVIYVAGTVDEGIYAKEDWSDLTGRDTNHYLLWPLDPDFEPLVQPGPPREPVPGEEAEWERQERRIPEVPVPWLGVLPDAEYSVDTRGNVSTPEGMWIENPQNVAELVERVRGRPGGRFRVTPLFQLVLVFGEVSEGGMRPLLVGQLAEPLRTRPSAEVAEVPIVTDLKPGDPYTGPLNDEEGSYRFRQKFGGVIERTQGRLSQFALTEPPDDRRAANALELLGAWRSLGGSGFAFFVNSAGHAWYRAEGQPRFLGDIGNAGLLWPDTTESRHFEG